MKTLFNFFLSLGLLIAAQSASAETDSKGVQCETKVARIARAYFAIVDTSSKVDFVISSKDQINVQNFKNTTPGSYNQEYLADVQIKFDRSNKWAPEQDQKVRLKLTGDYDCDNLKVKNIKAMGGVERVD
ncbi:hypothetical protein [Bdellovibrio sp. NC01]|uniref:hypothetical protein n=1 Tax=Bdellovibrio sp. NC01 TaxID=2220073 RepID=UPI0011584968|nr:hypothetical protein [Bdellovibrio sp. NC01]QDK38066.1 hypothetical protein DOE51_10940 [Bdellovibrio sp. NC01]